MVGTQLSLHVFRCLLGPWSLIFLFRSFSEIRANLDLSLWPNVEDPATQHPFSARLVQMLETYRRLYKETGKRQPLIKNAKYESP